MQYLLEMTNSTYLHEEVGCKVNSAEFNFSSCVDEKIADEVGCRSVKFIYFNN